MSAALLNHSKAVIPWRGSPSGVGMCVDLRGNGSLVTRRTASIEDRRISSRDTIWLTPPDVQEGEIDIDADITDILHIHLPLSRFSSANFGLTAAKSGMGALRYEVAFEDPLLAEIAHAVASELQARTCAGDLLIDSLAASMTARLIQKHTRASIARCPGARFFQPGQFHQSVHECDGSSTWPFSRAERYATFAFYPP